MIEVKDLYFRYPEGNSDVLSGISLTIAPGDSVSMMGANGSGKSTFARCLNALLQPTSGTVKINEMLTTDKEAVDRIRRLVGMVFQNPDNQIVSTTVEREIAFGLENLGLDYQDMVEKVQTILEEFQLEKYRKRPPHHLSGGEKQLLALAAVLAMEPEYLILDEPTSLLDPYSRKKLLNTIFQPQSRGAKTFTPILITQYPEETLLTRRLIILHQGKVLWDAPPEQVFSHAQELLELGIGVPLEFLVTRKGIPCEH